MAPVQSIKEDENDEFDMDPSVFDENVSIYKSQTQRNRKDKKIENANYGIKTNSARLRDLAAKKDLNLLQKLHAITRLSVEKNAQKPEPKEHM